MKVRNAHINDLKSIVNIYNQAILKGGCTADTKTFSVEDKANWFAQTNTEKYGIHVIEFESKIVGYFYFSPWRGKRKALENIQELSFYIDFSYHSQGIGSFILDEAIKIAKNKKLQHLITILLDINIKSYNLLKKFNFKEVGYLKSIAQFKSYTCGQFIMLKPLI